MEGYRCLNCGTLKDKGDIVYFIEGLNGIDYPVCSVKCVKDFKQYKIDILANEILKIKESKVTKEVW